MRLLLTLFLLLASIVDLGTKALAGDFGDEQCTYYVKQVNDTGNDEDCLTSPGCGLQQAVLLAENNFVDDVICIQGGTYLVNDPVFYTVKVLKESNIKVIGDYSSQVVIDSKNTYGSPFIFDSTFSPSSKKEIVIKNITFTSSAPSTQETSLGPVFYSFKNNLTIENCKFINLKDKDPDNTSYDEVYGLLAILSSSGKVTLKNNIFSGCSSKYVNVLNLINIQGETIIENNEFKDNETTNSNTIAIISKGKTILNANTIINNKSLQDGSIVNIKSFPESQLNSPTKNITEKNPVIVTNNVFAGNQTDTSSLSIKENSYIEPTAAPNDIFVINNTFYKNSNNSISPEIFPGMIVKFGNSASHKVYIQNNILWNDTNNSNPKEIYLEKLTNGNSDIEIKNNLTSCSENNGSINFDGDCAKVNGIDTDQITNSNNISTDPMFLSVSSSNPIDWNLHLSQNSPCIDSGNYSNESFFPKKDKDGKNRKLGNGVDIGAYEFTPKTSLSITLTGNGGGNVQSNPPGIDCGNGKTSCSMSVEINKTYTITATPNEKSNFTGWSGDCTSCGSNKTCSISIDSSKSCYAEFTLKTLQSVNLEVIKLGDGNGRVLSVPTKIDCGNTCSATYSRGQEITLSVILDSNSEIEIWGGACESCKNNNVCKIVLDKDSNCYVTIKKKESEKKYTLQVEKDGTGSGLISSNDNSINCGNKCSNLFKENTQITLTATPDQRSHFSGWSKDCSYCGTNNQCTVKIDKNMSCKAVFSSVSKGNNTYTIHFEPNGNGSIISNISCENSNNCQKELKEDTKVELIAVSGPDSYFVKWGGDCFHCNTEKCVVYLTKDTNCYAEFKPIPPNYHKLIVEKEGKGKISGSNEKINCGDNCETILQENSIITLTASPEENYKFKSWEEDCSTCGNNPTCDITLNSSKTCKASFIKKQEISTSSSGGGGCTLNPNNNSSFILLLALPAFFLIRRMRKTSP